MNAGQSCLLELLRAGHNILDTNRQRPVRGHGPLSLSRSGTEDSALFVSQLDGVQHHQRTGTHQSQRSPVWKSQFVQTISVRTEDLGSGKDWIPAVVAGFQQDPIACQKDRTPQQGEHS